jgi:hypothetical protein
MLEPSMKRPSPEERETICHRQVELVAEVQRHLQTLINLAQAEQEAVAARNENVMMELDRQIENAVGAMERALGALCAHRADHGC